jgi:hypothetical protein
MKARTLFGILSFGGAVSLSDLLDATPAELNLAFGMEFVCLATKSLSFAALSLMVVFTVIITYAAILF